MLCKQIENRIASAQRGHGGNRLLQIGGDHFPWILKKSQEFFRKKRIRSFLTEAQGCPRKAMGWGPYWEGIMPGSRLSMLYLPFSRAVALPYGYQSFSEGRMTLGRKHRIKSQETKRSAIS